MNERAITTDSTDNERTITKYYEELYANKFNNFDKIGKFPEEHKLPK